MNMSRKLKIEQESRVDYGIILTIIILALIGLISVYATTTMINGENIAPTLFHALWYAVGSIAVIVVMQFNSEQYWKLSTYLYGLGLLLLVFVLIFYDRQLAAETGARSWFRLGSLSFQPSEVVKPAYIIMLARVVTQHNHEFIERTLKSDWLLLGKIAVVALPAMVLIQLQNDLGTNLVMLAITGGVILVSGISWKILLPAILIVVALAAGILSAVVFFPDFLIENKLVQAYQINRIKDWLEPFADTRGSGYQLAQSIKAIGSGQLLGKGLGVSEVTVPVRESDFIFTTIGENFGFIGASFLLLNYFILIYQMVQTCFKTKNEFYTYIATGVISMILFHILENIGMNIGLLPITGVPLPFISQGGSALLSNMIGVGLILSMRYHYKSYIFDNDDF